ncbi:UNVERIFIED_CONTAM: hypothetical protein FKN15_050978 [Acipenser sinensis]
MLMNSNSWPNTTDGGASNALAPRYIQHGSTAVAEDLLHIPVYIEGVPCTSLVDTGSSMTLVRPDILRRARGDRQARLEPTIIQLRTVKGELTQMEEKGPMAVQIGAVEVQQEVWVAAVQQTPASWY